MRRIPLALMMLLSLAGCGSEDDPPAPPDVVFQSSGGYGFPDVQPGDLLILSAVTVCIDRARSASIESVSFDGPNAPAVESFSVRRPGPDDADAEVVGTSATTTNGSTEVTDQCPAGAAITPADAQRLSINVRMPAERVDITSISVSYSVGDVGGRQTVPLRTSMCPPGSPGSGDCSAGQEG